MLARAEGLWDSLLHIPYRVDSHFTEYSGNGAVTHRHTLTSFMSDGKEIFPSHTFPADWLRTGRTHFVRRTRDHSVPCNRGTYRPPARKDCPCVRSRRARMRGRWVGCLRKLNSTWVRHRVYRVEFQRRKGEDLTRSSNRLFSAADDYRDPARRQMISTSF
jgi:hypothetical protein